MIYKFVAVIKHIMTQLIDLIEGATWPHLAVENKDYETLISARGIDFNCIDCEGETPLHYAASNNDVEICKILISKSPDLNETINSLIVKSDE